MLLSCGRLKIENFQIDSGFVCFLYFWISPEVDSNLIPMMSSLMEPARLMVWLSKTCLRLVESAESWLLLVETAEALLTVSMSWLVLIKTTDTRLHSMVLV